MTPRGPVLLDILGLLLSVGFEGSGVERAVADVRHVPVSRHKESADAFNKLWCSADRRPPPPLLVGTVAALYCTPGHNRLLLLVL